MRLPLGKGAVIGHVCPMTEELYKLTEQITICEIRYPFLPGAEGASAQDASCASISQAKGRSYFTICVSHSFGCDFFVFQKASPRGEAVTDEVTDEGLMFLLTVGFSYDRALGIVI